MGLPGVAPVSSTPVTASTLEATASQIGLSSAQAAASPPGIRDGPKRAPSSPPDTPEPMKRRPLALSSFSRRMVSVQRALPPSMMMSPGSKAAASSLITASVGPPALTRMTALRGFLREAAKSLMVGQPVSLPGVFGFSFTNSSVLAVVRLYTEIAKPWSAMLRARF